MWNITTTTTSGHCYEAVVEGSFSLLSSSSEGSNGRRLSQNPLLSGASVDCIRRMMKPLNRDTAEMTANNLSLKVWGPFTRLSPLCHYLSMTPLRFCSNGQTLSSCPLAAGDVVTERERRRWGEGGWVRKHRTFPQETDVQFQRETLFIHNVNHMLIIVITMMNVVWHWESKKYIFEDDTQSF